MLIWQRRGKKEKLEDYIDIKKWNKIKIVQFSGNMAIILFFSIFGWCSLPFLLFLRIWKYEIRIVILCILIKNEDVMEFLVAGTEMLVVLCGSTM